MKLVIAIALVSMVSAFEEIQPVVLPEAPAPAFETGVPIVEPIDFGLLMVPQEVVDELQRLQNTGVNSNDVPVNSVRFVDNTDDISNNVPENSVHFVDNTDDISNNVPENSVRFVDNSDDISNNVPENSVRFVDNTDDISNNVPENFVRFVANSDDISNNIPGNSVHFVDNTDDMPSNTVIIVELGDESPFPVNSFEKIAESELDSVRVVDIPIVFQDEKVQDTVQVVDMPLSDDVPRVYRGKTYSNPNLR